MTVRNAHQVNGVRVANNNSQACATKDMSAQEDSLQRRPQPPLISRTTMTLLQERAPSRTTARRDLATRSHAQLVLIIPLLGNTNAQNVMHINTAAESAFPCLKVHVHLAMSAKEVPSSSDLMTI